MDDVGNEENSFSDLNYKLNNQFNTVGAIAIKTKKRKAKKVKPLPKVVEDMGDSLQERSRNESQKQPLPYNIDDYSSYKPDNDDFES